MRRISPRTHLRLAVMSLFLTIAVLFVLWRKDYRVVVQPISQWDGRWYEGAHKGWRGGDRSLPEIWASSADYLLELVDGREHSLFTGGVEEFEYLFVPATIYPDVYPYLICGAGGNCPGMDPLDSLEGLGNLPYLPAVYHLGIFWIGTPSALHLVTFSEAERNAIRERLFLDVCRQSCASRSASKPVHAVMGSKSKTNFE